MRKQSYSLGIARMMIAVGLAWPTQAAEVFVRVAPPRPLVERVVPAPSPRHVWVAGYYRWNGRAYLWVPGRWVVPRGR